MKSSMRLLSVALLLAAGARAGQNKELLKQLVLQLIDGNDIDVGALLQSTEASSQRRQLQEQGPVLSQCLASSVMGNIEDIEALRSNGSSLEGRVASLESGSAESCDECSQIESLRDENEALRARVAQLEGWFGNAANCKGDVYEGWARDDQFGAYASFWQPEGALRLMNDSANPNRVHWDQWGPEGPEGNGWFSATADEPQAFCGFSYQCSSNCPAFAVEYDATDAGSWQVAFTQADNHSERYDAEWESVGAHRTWRYRITGSWTSGPWYWNFRYYECTQCEGQVATPMVSLADMERRLQVVEAFVVEESRNCKGALYEGGYSSVTGHAPHFTAGNAQAVMNNESNPAVVHWDQWGVDGWLQVDAAAPQAFCGFSYQCSSDCPAFRIEYRDALTGAFRTAYSQADSHRESYVAEWTNHGEHTSWRYLITGSWVSGPWYWNFRFFSCEPCE